MSTTEKIIKVEGSSHTLKIKLYNNIIDFTFYNNDPSILGMMGLPYIDYCSVDWTGIFYYNDILITQYPTPESWLSDMINGLIDDYSITEEMIYCFTNNLSVNFKKYGFTRKEIIKEISMAIEDTEKPAYLYVKTDVVSIEQVAVELYDQYYTKRTHYKRHISDIAEDMLKACITNQTAKSSVRQLINSTIEEAISTYLSKPVNLEKHAKIIHSELIFSKECNPSQLFGFSGL